MTTLMPPSEVVVFDIPNIGEVTISRTGTLLTVAGVRSIIGYTADIEIGSGPLVEVEFEGTMAHYVFRARVVSDVIVTDVSSHSFPVPGGSSTIPALVKREDDHEDDHEDEHEEEGDEQEDDD